MRFARGRILTSAPEFHIFQCNTRTIACYLCNGGEDVLSRPVTPSEWRFLTVTASVTAIGYTLWLTRIKWLYIIPVDGYPRTRTRIIFDDLFHNLDPRERYSITVFGGMRSRVRAAKRAINDDLKGIVEVNPGITQRELFSMWCSFGDPPTVSGSG